jgi:type VI secretion system protein ImpH
LQEQAHQFEFFQAVRLMHWLAREPVDANGPRRPLGGDFAPGQEVVRFRAMPSHSFPAGSVVELRPGGDEAAPPEMTVAFHGLTGPQGVLPQHYTTLLIERVRGKDFALRDFLDMFNHRALSYFYRAWRKYRFPFAYEESAVGNGLCAVPSPTERHGVRSLQPEGRTTNAEDDLFTYVLYCLLGTGGQRGRAEFEDEALLYFAGHFAHWPRSAVALEGILNEYFSIPAAVKQFQGEWLYLAVEDRSALPSTRGKGDSPVFADPLRGYPAKIGTVPGKGQYTALGAEAVIGQRVWDVESKFRIRLGPLSYAEFRRLLPDGDMLRPVREMVRLYAGPHLEFDVQLVLKRHEVPRCRLGGDAAGASRLGWNTWVRHGEFSEDVDDAVFASEG